MICLSGAVKYCVHNYVEYHFMSYNCVIHLSLKLFPLGSMLVLIISEEKPIYCSYFFFGGKKFFTDEFNPLEAYVCVNFLNGITANITE